MENIIKFISDDKRQLKIQQVVLGLGYVAVLLENGSVGLSANIMHNQHKNCTVFKGAGSLKGSSVGDVFSLHEKPDFLPRSICLAALNALINVEGCGYDGDVFDEITVNAGDRVAMIGLIEPVAVMLKKKGCEVSLYEHRPVDHPLKKDQNTMGAMCRQADIIIITATSLINNTFSDIVKLAGHARDVILMGPSTPVSQQAFETTPVTCLAGSQVTDQEKALDIVMEGGGTQALFRHKAMNKVIRKLRQ